MERTLSQGVDRAMEREATMTTDFKSSRSQDDGRRRAVHLRGSGRSGVDNVVPGGHLSELPGPLWTDLFYIAVAFGTASGLFWLAGY